MWAIHGTTGQALGMKTARFDTRNLEAAVRKTFMRHQLPD